MQNTCNGEAAGTVIQENCLIGPNVRSTTLCHQLKSSDCFIIPGVGMLGIHFDSGNVPMVKEQQSLLIKPFQISTNCGGRDVEDFSQLGDAHRLLLGEHLEN
ncbi:MAG: hypothetical protein M0Q37_05345 [Sphaerochaeta sp.]|nr:hypothetical protein [Sphaerochaeta sp.]